MVSAWATKANIALGQLKVEEKSNEIPIIPILLDALSIKDTIVITDAMGCQTAIASKIIEKKADYILAVKGNQKQLYEDIEFEFKLNNISENETSIDFGHGRIETRKCSLIDEIENIEKINA